MSIYRLADASLATNPEVLVVHKEMLRSFSLEGDSQYPIAFRGDDRKLMDVIDTGFMPRTTVLAKYSNVRKGGVTYDRLREIRAELEDRFAGPGRDAKVEAYLKNMIAVNVGNVDIDKDTAVCCTRDIRVAGMFPYDAQDPSVLNKPTLVYVVRLRSWFETYRVQAGLAPHLTYSQEVACLGIPPEDILGCIVVTRKLVGEHIVLTFGGTAQPGEHDEGEEDNEFEKLVASLPNEMPVPVPKQKDSNAKEMLDEEKIPHLQAAIKSLTGIYSSNGFERNYNTIRGNKVIELEDYKPVPPKKKVELTEKAAPKEKGAKEKLGYKEAPF